METLSFPCIIYKVKFCFLGENQQKNQSLLESTSFLTCLMSTFPNPTILSPHITAFLLVTFSNSSSRAKGLSTPFALVRLLFKTL
jgi:hypothetical protein